MKKHLLIDADIPAYQACSAHMNEVGYEIGDDMVYSWTVNLTDAEQMAVSLIETMVKTLKADSCMLALTGKENFRKDLLPSYKDPRSKTKKPLAHTAVRQALTDKYETVLVSGIEGDDVLGILSTSPEYMADHQKIIVSIDKDFKTIPGWLYNPTERTLTEVTEEDADRYLYIQAIAGDRTDNYLGITGYGEKTAEKYLAGVPHEDLWKKTLELYLNKGYTEEEALVQLRCARILRYEDWDNETSKPRLFVPE